MSLTLPCIAILQIHLIQLIINKFKTGYSNNRVFPILVLELTKIDELD